MAHEHVQVVLGCVANPVRRDLLLALTEGELCVGDLIVKTGREQSLVSYHLHRLRNCGLVTSRREAQKVLYQLSRPSVRDMLRALERTSRDIKPLCQDPECGGSP